MHQPNDRNFWIVLSADIILLCLAYYSACYIRFDGNIPAGQIHQVSVSISWIVALKLSIYFPMGLYRGLWRYTGLGDILKIFQANALAFFLILLAFGIWTGWKGFSRGVIVMDTILSAGFISGFRMAIRCLTLDGVWKARLLQFMESPPETARKTLVVGAGDAAEKLLREVKQNRKFAIDVVGLVDDDSRKQGRLIHGVGVIGFCQDIPELIITRDIDQIIIAIPSATARQMRQVADICKSTGKPYKTVPGLPDLIMGRVSISAIRDVSYEDLLGRDSVCQENNLICSAYVSGKPVMVTGAAGSIGSELCRQIAALQPSRLILVDRNESGLYELNLDLLSKFPGLETAEVLSAVQNRGQMDQVFRVYRPEVVFHAAAYKHVPMMEIHPWEAVYNNIVGSYVLLDMCLVHQVDRCVVISTDKAVRPTNVMGASKRVVERLVQSYARINGVKYMAVRFGNVLGSAGSVLPLFKKQIAMGGPVTVTHPDITRYFMTIPEAVSLVMQAGGIGTGGEIFVLKMGTPVRIADMARDLITLSGFVPDKEIKIEFRGLRPGEKLFEELITTGEDVDTTRIRDIMILKNDDILSFHEAKRHIQDLIRLAGAMDASGIKKKLTLVVPEYAAQVTPQGLTPLSQNSPGSHGVTNRKEPVYPALGTIRPVVAV